MKKARFSHAAQTDLIAIARYIADAGGSRRIASEFTATLRQRCHKLADTHGTLGMARGELAENLRSVPFKHYTIFFRYAGDDVHIVTILHGLHGMRDIDAYFDSE